MNKIIITRQEDKPIASDEFVTMLDTVGVPKSWIKLPRKSLRASGIKWIKY
jgi:hypothetical protein